MFAAVLGRRTTGFLSVDRHENAAYVDVLGVSGAVAAEPRFWSAGKVS